MSITDTTLLLQFFTDPLCCWSWAMEPHLQQLQVQLGQQMQLIHHMGGLIQSWDHYSDNDNAVYTPTQMGPLWMYAGQITGATFDAALWVNDPPASSWPACQAVKCAQLQGNAAGAACLALLRTAVMTRGQNIARTEVLAQVVDELARAYAGFDPGVFWKDMETGRGLQAFNEDLKLKAQYGIVKLPVLLVTCGHTTIRLTGYRSLEQLVEVVKRLMEQPEQAHA